MILATEHHLLGDIFRAGNRAVEVIRGLDSEHDAETTADHHLRASVRVVTEPQARADVHPAVALHGIGRIAKWAEVELPVEQPVEVEKPAVSVGSSGVAT